MSGRRSKGGKAKIEMSKPELPAFLQRMREQIVANEDADRIAQSLKKRKERGERGEDPEEGPTIVKIGDEDLTEEEYNRMKLALETQYKLDSEIRKGGPENEELDVDKLLERRQAASQAQDSAGSYAQAEAKPEVEAEGSNSSKTRSSKRHKPLPSAAAAGKAKKLSYDDDDDDSDSSS